MTTAICPLMPHYRKRPYIEDMDVETYANQPTKRPCAREIDDYGAMEDAALLSDPEVYARAARMSDSAFLRWLQEKNPVNVLKGNTEEDVAKKREYNRNYWRTKLKKCPDRHHSGNTNNGERSK